MTILVVSLIVSLVVALLIYATINTIALRRVRRDVLAIVDGVEHAAPCSDPGCIAARIDLRNVARSHVSS